MTKPPPAGHVQLAFYTEVLQRLRQDGVLQPTDSILVVCGGRRDRQALLDCGFENVTISNIQDEKGEYEPYAHSLQDVENLTFEDGSFDFVLVHSGLHHCHSPHRALLEMYRVARKGILFYEPCDNAINRLALALGLGQRYELAAVANTAGRFGGVAGGPVPNHIYRFSEGETRRIFDTFAPYGPHRYRFLYKFRIPWIQLCNRRNKLPYYLLALASPFIWLFFQLFPKQSNNFAALVLKPRLPEELFPWLEETAEGYRTRMAYLKERFPRMRALQEKPAGDPRREESVDA